MTFFNGSVPANFTFPFLAPWIIGKGSEAQRLLCKRSAYIVTIAPMALNRLWFTCATSICIRTQNRGAGDRNLELYYLPLLDVKRRAKLRRVICLFLYYGAAIPMQKLAKRNENHSAKTAHWMETLLQTFAGGPSHPPWKTRIKLLFIF